MSTSDAFASTPIFMQQSQRPLRLAPTPPCLRASVVAVSFAVLALASAGCSDSAAKDKVAGVATYKVERRDLRATVSEKGTLKAANQILVRPEIPGQAKIV